MLSKQINELLKLNNLTKKEFAEKIQVAPPQVTRYIKGDQNISSNTIIKICKVFNVSSDWLLGLKNNIN